VTVQAVVTSRWGDGSDRFFGQGDWKMRALTMNELAFVGGGWDNTDDPLRPGSGTKPIPGSDGDDQFGLWGDFKKAVKSFLSDIGIDVGAFVSMPDGDGPCLDADGNVIRNANGDPLLKCRTTTGGFRLSWGH
jgi:hypothetical protein